MLLLHIPIDLLVMLDIFILHSFVVMFSLYLIIFNSSSD
jgi:hypothetical protein